LLCAREGVQGGTATISQSGAKEDQDFLQRVQWQVESGTQCSEPMRIETIGGSGFDTGVIAPREN
jgi:hypothetical protein